MSSGHHAIDPIDFSTVTEVPGTRGSRQQLARLCNRYYFASQYAAGKDVLEVGCGCGPGLGLLARSARRVVGLDINARSVAAAQQHYGGRVEILHGDAEALPFSKDKFDLLLLYEAIYYLACPERFLHEA